MSPELGDVLIYVGVGIVVILGMIVGAFFALRAIANRSSLPSSEVSPQNRPLPRPIDSKAPSPGVDLDRSSGQRPVWLGRDRPLSPLSPELPRPDHLRQVIESHVIGLKQAGYDPDVKELPDGDGYVLTISSHLPGQQQSAYIYLWCGPDFPHSPPQPVASVVCGSDQHAELKEKEVALFGLKTVSAWKSDSTLSRVVREIEACLDEDLVEQSKISDIFTKYGEIIQKHAK